MQRGCKQYLLKYNMTIVTCYLVIIVVKTVVFFRYLRYYTWGLCLDKNNVFSPKFQFLRRKYFGLTPAWCLK